jgi:outer membrane protein
MRVLRIALFLLHSSASLLWAQAPDTLELSEAIQIGLESNFNIKIAGGEAEIASNFNTLGFAGFLPVLNLSAGKRYTVENTSQKFISGQEQNVDGAKSNALTGGLALDWTIFNGGRMFYAKERLSELERQSLEQNRAVIQQIIARISIEFYTVALEQIRLNLLDQNIDISQDRLNIAQNKYELGKVSKLEYLQAQVDLNRDISNAMIQQERLAASKSILNELLARDVTIDFFVKFDPELNADLRYEDLKAAMAAGNPNLSVAQSRVEVAALERKELTGLRLPEIGLNLGYNYARSEAQAGFLLNRQSSGINYGVTANWNLFDGMNLNRRIDNAGIVRENREFDLQALQVNLERELYAIYLNYQNNIQLSRLEDDNRKVAQENNDIAFERYRVGASSPLELREAQINLLEANLRFLNAAYAVKTAEIDLLLLAGKIFQ